MPALHQDYNEQTTIISIKLMHAHEINVGIHIIRMTLSSITHFSTFESKSSTTARTQLNRLKLLRNSTNNIQQIILQLL